MSFPCQYLTSMPVAIKGRVSSKSVRGGHSSVVMTYRTTWNLTQVKFQVAAKRDQTARAQIFPHTLSYTNYTHTSQPFICSSSSFPLLFDLFQPALYFSLPHFLFPLLLHRPSILLTLSVFHRSTSALTQIYVNYRNRCCWVPLWNKVIANETLTLDTQMWHKLCLSVRKTLER